MEQIKFHLVLKVCKNYKYNCICQSLPIQFVLPVNGIYAERHKKECQCVGYMFPVHVWIFVSHIIFTYTVNRLQKLLKQIFHGNKKLLNMYFKETYQPLQTVNERLT